MQPAAAVSFVGGTLTRGASTCLGTASLAWLFRPKPPFNTNGDVIFRYHFDVPNHEVLFYHKLLLYMEGIPESALKLLMVAGAEFEPATLRLLA
jgi:hypothetical protein